MVANRDLMALALEPVYGSVSTNLADWEGLHWVAEGFEPAGPGDKAAWYAAQGATGTYYGDLEADYWASVYAGGGGSAPTNTVAPALNDVAPDAGETLTVTTGTWTGTPTITYAYQWESSVTGSGGWSDVSGETTSSLLLDGADEGLFFRCEVTATNGIGSDIAYSDVAEVTVSTDPGLALLQSATLWLDASDAVSGAQWLRNKGTGGRALDARVGSVGQAQIINGALKLPGVTGNYASAPHSVPLGSISGDIDLVVQLSMPDWTPSAEMTIIARRAASQVWQFRVNAGGKWMVVWLDSGATQRTLETTAVPTITDGATIFARCFLDVDNGSGQCQASFYTSTDGASWTLLETVVGAFGTSSIISATSILEIGSRTTGTASNLNASVYRAQVWSGDSTSGGTKVFDADFTAQSTLATSFTESSSNAATVTINSTSGVDTNDPLLLPHTGTNYLYLPGVSGNTATSPDSAALSITGDFELVLRVDLDDWTPAAESGLLNKLNGAATIGYALSVLTTGGLRLFVGDGTARLLSSTANVPFTDGQVGWIKVTYDADNGTGNSSTQFFTAADQSTEPSSWTQLGSTVLGTIAAPSDGTDVLTLGMRGGSNFAAAGFFRTIIRNGIGGTTVFDADFTANTNQSSFTESSSNAATVTINRATSGRKSVMVVRPTLLFGTDDYLEVADNDLLDFAVTEDFTVMAVARRFNTLTTYDVLVAKRNLGASDTGWALAFDLSNQVVLNTNGGGSTNATAGTPASGDRVLASGVRDTTADTLTTYLGSTAGTPLTETAVSTLANARALRIGVAPDASFYTDGEIDTIAIFRSALTSTELGQIATYLGV